MEPTRAELEAAHCWESVDRVPGDPEMTAFKRRARYQQALWRDQAGIPIGTQPAEGGPNARQLGSRIDLAHANATGSNFITGSAHAAARARLAAPEPQQTLNPARLWADLLSSMPMCFNLFGDLHADPTLASQVARAWWPALPGKVSAVRFEWSPGRADPMYLNNRTAFDAALTLDLGSEKRGVVGIETKYHEHPVTEAAPTGAKLLRYVEVSERSGVFRPGAVDRIVGTPLQQIWLDHLLVLSMLQHPTAHWDWGRFALVHPAGNVGSARLASQYATLLVDDSTFTAHTLEELLAAESLPMVTVERFRDRYLWDNPVTEVEDPELTAEWPGATRADLFDDMVEVRDAISEAAHEADWSRLCELIADHPQCVNAPRLDRGDGLAPLHQAARHGADPEIVQGLLDAGAWRTLRTTDGSRAVDIAKSQGHHHLIDLLDLDTTGWPSRHELQAVELYLHALINVRTLGIREGRPPLWLPQVEPLLELGPGRSIWFNVPMMYGGFDLRWNNGAVISSSWCRVVDGSGQHHRITNEGIELTADATDL